MRKIVIVLLCISLFGAVFSFSSCGKTSNGGYSKTDPKTYLIVGLDDAASNTDVISLVRVSCGQISVLQIPRDTYVDIGSYPNKINHFVPRSVCNGNSIESAVSGLASLVSNTFGVKIDGYIAVKSSDVRSFVDSIGGVYVNCDRRRELIAGDDVVLQLEEGENLLTGDEAIHLIRHRAGYPRADIDRLDMQSLFYGGLLNTVRGRVSPTKIIGAYLGIRSSVVSSVPYTDVLKMISRRNEFKNAELRVTRVPGEAVLSECGLWYYVINKEETQRTLSNVFSNGSLNFDPENRFLPKEATLSDVYFK